jgi:hypothetical protein
VATQCGQCESGARELHSQCQTSAPQGYCHRAEISADVAVPQLAKIQLATSILESTSWKRSLPLPVVSYSP